MSAAQRTEAPRGGPVAARWRLGGDLVVRTGEPVAEIIRVAQAVGAEGVMVAADVSRYAAARARRLARECQRYRIGLRELPGVTVVPPGGLKPAGGAGHYRVFTPYWRAWDGTGSSRLSPYLHFDCLSARELAGCSASTGGPAPRSTTSG
jgi:deoxyribodipyrimidine photolyase